MCIKGRRGATEECLLMESSPRGKPVVFGVYAATPKDNEWFSQARKKTKGIRTGSRPAE